MPHPDANAANRVEERLLLDTLISRVLSDLSLLKPDDPDYAALDQKYQELLERRRKLP